MSNDFGSFGSQPPNPYSSPTNFGSENPRGSTPVKVIAPGVALVIVGAIGFCFSMFNCIYAINTEPTFDPNAPAWLQEMQKGASGPFAAVIHGTFALVNLVIIAGGVQMARISTWAFALTASIIAMVNIGSGCCLLGIPIGIWSIVILAQEDVRQLFRMRSQGAG